MPLIKSSSPAATKANFHEFRHGPTFQKTEAKYGKAKAVAQMEAAVLSTARKAKQR